MRHAFLFLSLILMSINACEEPSSLEAIAGIQGRIEFIGSKPDSINSVALVVLWPEAINDLSNIGEYLVDYSIPQSGAGEYFIELKPGTYMGVVAGLLIDPGLFAVNVDSYIENGNLPVVQLTEGANAFPIREKEMLERDWTVDFSQ